jgi:hypothetical protein
VPKNSNAKFLESWARLCANWPLVEPRATNLAKEYYEVFKEITPQRFDDGVTKVINDSQYQYFPNVSEFRGYIPRAADGAKGFWRDPDCIACQGSGFQVKYFQEDGLPVLERCKNPECLHMGVREDNYRELQAKRRAYPDDFFSESDVKTMMTIALDRHKRKLHPLSGDEMIAAVLEIRHSCQEARR